LSIIASKQIKLKKLFHITATSFPNTTDQILALKLGDCHCCFAITDVSGEKLNELVYYSANEINESSLINLFVNHPELNNSFHKIAISYDFTQAVLVPEDHFRSEEAYQLLKTFYGLQKEVIVVAQSIPDEYLHIAYATPKETNEWLHRKFPLAQYFHNYSVGIQKVNSYQNFLVDFRTNEFSLIIKKENKLLLTQVFPYSNPDDVIYYLLKAAQQFSLSPTELKMSLSGLIEKESAMFKELHQFFLNLEFRSATWKFEGDNECPSHFFTSLNDLIQCAS
jgi:hypothetical protein